MKTIRYLPLNGFGKCCPKPLWPDDLVKRIIGDVELYKPNYQKYYLIPNSIIPDKHLKQLINNGSTERKLYTSIQKL